MAYVVTLEYQAAGPVQINWGEPGGGWEIFTASPAHHLYAGSGVHNAIAIQALEHPELGYDSGQVDCGTATWDTVAATYATWNALAAANPTWTDVLNG